MMRPWGLMSSTANKIEMKPFKLGLPLGPAAPNFSLYSR